MKNNKLLIVGTAIALAISGIAGITSHRKASGVYADTTTYTFSSKSWAASGGNWTSGKDGSQMQSGRGVQVTTGVSGANATSPVSFTDVSQIIVTYSTNANAGAGSISIQVGSNEAVSKDVTKTGGTADRTLTWDYSPEQTGKIKMTITCTTNSIYVKSVSVETSSLPIEATFAEALAAGKALNSGDTSDSYYKFPAYVTEKDGNNYYLTATQNGSVSSDTAIELYKAGLVDGLPAKLLQNAYVEVTMLLKNYNGTVENGNTLTNDSINVVTPGTAWVISTEEVSVTEALSIIDELENGETTHGLYEIEGYIVGVQYTWTENNGITYTLGETANAADTLSVYKSNVGAANQGDCSTLVAGDKVSVVGNLQRYVNNSNVMTPQVKNGATTLVTPGPNHPVDIPSANLDTYATEYSVSTFLAETEADDTVLAKATGVADDLYNTTNGYFHLVDVSSGDNVLVYGGYTTVQFQKAGDSYSVKSKSSVVTSALVGHTVTVYGTINVHNGVAQFKDALVVDSGNVATVNASVSVNNNEMGSAIINHNSVAYGAEIIVTPTPASGYKVGSVTVERLSRTDTLHAEANGVYKFNAESKNVVTVTFVVDSSSGLVETVEIASSIAIGDTVFLGCRGALAQYNGPSGTSQDAYGTYSSFVNHPDSSVYALEVCAGNENGEFAFKILEGTYANEYLGWSGSKNSLKVTATLDANSSWTVEFDSDDNATISNAANSNRVIWWNEGSPRFACYTGKTADATYFNVQLWKLSYTSPSSPEDYLDSTLSTATLHGSESSASGSKKYTVSFANSALANESVVKNIHIGPVLLNGDKGTNENETAPKYFNNGHELRFYAHNTFTFSAESAITKIAFTFSGGSASNLSVPSGSFTENEWNGESSSITFTNSSESQVKITAVEVTCNESLSINSIALRFGATISKTTWDTINDDWEISDYGLMVVKKTTLETYNGSTIKEAYNNGERGFAIINKTIDDTPFDVPYYESETNSYYFTLKINITGAHNIVYCAAPFIVAGGQYYFLNEMEYSVNTLAQKLLSEDNYPSLTPAALSILAND